jgi:hypothetical protein
MYKMYTKFAPYIDAESVLDGIQAQASDFCGEPGDEWYAYDHKKHDELDELSDELTAVVIAWFEKYGYSPLFWAVENIKEYPLSADAAQDGGQGE